MRRERFVSEWIANLRSSAIHLCRSRTACNRFDDIRHTFTMIVATQP